MQQQIIWKRQKHLNVIILPLTEFFFVCDACTLFKTKVVLYFNQLLLVG